MDFDFEAHERKLRDRRTAEENAVLEKNAQLNSIAEQLLNRIAQYAGNRRTLSRATVEQNVIKLYYPSKTMTLTVTEANEFEISVSDLQSKDGFYEFSTTHNDEEMMSAVVNFVTDKS